MADFLLIHGSCHGAWCWRDLIPALKAAGHGARAIDLPGNGDSPIPPCDATLAGSAEAICAASMPDTIIVGHSWGGYPIGAAAERDPTAMRALVYLCAYVPVNGLSMADMRKQAPRQLPADAVIRNPDGITLRIAPDKAEALFYNDCPPEAVAYALPRLCPQAVLPQSTPIEITERFDAVPKFYIRSTDDHVIPTEYQAEMVKDWPKDRVFEMQTSHSPFFAEPQGLAARLTRIAGAI